LEFEKYLIVAEGPFQYKPNWQEAVTDISIN